MRSDIDANAFMAESAPVPPAEFIRALLRTGFSPEAYRDAYGDLRERDMPPTDLLGHYFRFGIRERRHAPLTLNRNALIDLAQLPIGNADFKAALLTSLVGHPLDDFGHPYGPAIAELWPMVSLLAREQARPYLVTGDSHSSHYAMTGCHAGDWLLPMHMICHGGSARGLGNAASRSGYGEHLRQVVRTIGELPGAGELPFLMQFGQVDIEFVHHFHRVRDDRRTLDLGEYRQFCATTVERYIGFATGLFDPAQRGNVFLVSVFPPALSDDAWRHGHLNDDIVRRESDISREELAAGIRGLEIATLRQRTEIHAFYNELLHAACDRNGFRFVDGFTPFLGSDGVVDQRYTVPEGHGFEHHLNSRRTHDILSNLLWDIMIMVGRPPPRVQVSP